jgi:hypothetical protein
MLSETEPRRAMSQLNLTLADPPAPEATLWDQFEETHRQIVIEMLARLLLKAARTHTAREETDD